MKTIILSLLSIILIVACSRDDIGNTSNYDVNSNNESNCNGDNPIYLDDNGITIKACEWALIGDSGEVNGITYTIVDIQILEEILEAGGDVTKVCTTRILDMSGMFKNIEIFNQDISNWDVSNVTDMGGMFYDTDTFNQPIGDWDVSNVTRMDKMFAEAYAFNQPLDSWDVNNVTRMGHMFYIATSFNQDLSSWGVDGVIVCGGFSDNTPQWTLPKPNFTNCAP